jgi:plasmid replication initiation protein
MKQKKGVWLDKIQTKENRLVVKSNYLIEASYKLSLQEARVILLLTSMINRDDEEFTLIRIRVKDFVEFVGVNDKDAYKRVQQITDSLGDKSLIVRGVNPETKEMTRLKLQWLASAEYFEGSGYVELEFSQKLKPFLLQLKDRFTKYQLEYALKLKKSYSIRIYELLKQWENLKARTIEIDELRDTLGLEKGTYQKYGHLKDRILKPAQKEISQKTDISFSFTEIKKRRKVVMIRFEIKSKNVKKQELLEPPKVEKIQNASLYQKLIDYFCVNPTDTLRILKKYPESQILQNLAYVEHYYNKGGVGSLGPYTLKAIKENYQLQLSLFDKEKEEYQKQKKQKENDQQQLRELEFAYGKYKRDKIEQCKQTLSAEELTNLENECRKIVESEKGKNRIGLDMFVRLKIESCLAEKAGILNFEQWKAEKITTVPSSVD